MNNHLSAINSFKETLFLSGYSENTIRAYANAVKSFYVEFDEINQINLFSFRKMILKQSPSTANLKINALNKYLSSIQSTIIPLKCVKNHRASHIENVITNEEYYSLLDYLKTTKRTLYCCVRLMSVTGIRISETMKVSYIDIERGYKDINSKGDKTRRIYFPSTLQQEFIDTYQGPSSVLFPNRNGKTISPSGIRFQLKKYGCEIGIPLSHLHPHSFRHRFALNFIQNGGDLTMLSDILGHETIETTRIYLRKSSEEQRKIINKLVIW